MMPYEFSNQAADGWPAGDDGCWHGHELTADQIEFFSPLNSFTCDGDPTVQFSNSHERGVPCPVPIYFSGCLSGTCDSVLFDGASAYSIAGTTEDGSTTTSLARSVAGDTSVDTMSDIGRRVHSAAQDFFAQFLELQKPQLVCVQDSFLCAFSGKGYAAAAGDGVDEVHVHEVDDGWPAGDDGCWNSHELTADQN